MTQDKKKLINLSVHESADPKTISPNPEKEASGDFNDLNDSVHDEENVDVPIPSLSDPDPERDILRHQDTISSVVQAD